MISQVSRRDQTERLLRYGILTVESALLCYELYRRLKLSQEFKHESQAVPSVDSSRSEVPKYFGVEKPDVTFDKVAGLDEVKETIKVEVVYPRLKKDVFELYDRKPGNGVLLYGPPGCGKTLLAKATAADCEYNTLFLAPSIGDIMSKWVGESEKIIDRIFRFASKNGKCVVFMDEIDAIVPRSGPTYVRRLKDAMLQNLDGISSRKNDVLVLGATNRPWLIDPAIRRPGRLGKTIFIPPPDLKAREQVLKLCLQDLMKKNMLASDVDLSEIALGTNGYSSADLVAICQKAVDIPLIEAIKGGRSRPIEPCDFAAAVSATKKSIIPWLNEAIWAIKRYNAHEFTDDTMRLAKDFGLPYA